MAVYQSSEKLLEVLQLLFGRVHARDHEAAAAVSKSRLIIRGPRLLNSSSRWPLSELTLVTTEKLAIEAFSLIVFPGLRAGVNRGSTGD